MSTWDLIESVILAQSVVLPLTARELFVVREAHASWVKKTLNEASAWDVLENYRVLIEAGEKPIKDLTDDEVNIIRHFDRNIKSKKGYLSGKEVVSLDLKTWQKIKQELESNPEYYEMLLGGMSNIKDLITKIESALSSEMGPKIASTKKDPVEPPNELSGGTKSDDPTPVVHGSAAHGQQLGWDELKQDKPEKLDIPTRQSKVYAQDVAGMNGSTKSVATVQDPKTQKKTDDMEDPSSWFEGRRR